MKEAAWERRPALPGQDTQSPSNPAPQPQLTEAEIIAKCQPQLESLQSQSVARVEELAAAAVQEYKTKQANGTLDKNEMVKKYLQAGYMLEAGVEEAFYRPLNAMQAELIANGHPTTASQEIKNRYVRSKAQKRNELLSRAGPR